MGGDDSQKLLPWRGIYSSPGRKPPAHYEINTVTETAPRLARLPAGVWLSYCLGHFWQAQMGQFWRVPKDCTVTRPGRGQVANTASVARSLWCYREVEIMSK